MEAVRTLKANLKLEGKPCGWCQHGLVLGEDAAVCTACEKEHHRGCWDVKAGCSTAGCGNAPLRRLDVAPPVATGSPASPFPGGGAPAAPAFSALSPGMMTCPRCQLAITIGTQVCPACRAITTPDGIYSGPVVNAPGAVQSLVFGIVGLFVCGVIFGPLAISKSSAARRAIEADPTFGGGGLATAGMVMGIIDIVAWAIIMISRFGQLGSH